MKRAAVLLAVPLILAASACGDDDDGGGGSASGDWCDLAQEISSLEDPFEGFDPTNPDDVEAAFGQLGDVLDDAVDAAPDEIRDDVEATADAFGELRSALEDADFNMLDLDLAELEAMGEDLEASSQRIEDFNEEECGITATDDDTESTEGATDADTESTEGAEDVDTEDTDTTDGDSDVAEGTIREQMIEGFVTSGFTEEEASCLVDNLDLSDPDMASDPTAMMELFDDCGIDLERLTELGNTLGG